MFIAPTYTIENPLHEKSSPLGASVNRKFKPELSETSRGSGPSTSAAAAAGGGSDGSEQQPQQQQVDIESVILIID